MYNRQKDFISKKYINQTETYGPIEVVSLLPNTENNDKKNYISFMFYEHKEEVTRYLNTRKKKHAQEPRLHVGLELVVLFGQAAVLLRHGTAGHRAHFVGRLVHLELLEPLPLH